MPLTSFIEDLFENPESPTHDMLHWHVVLRASRKMEVILSLSSYQMIPPTADRSVDSQRQTTLDSVISRKKHKRGIWD